MAKILTSLKNAFNKDMDKLDRAIDAFPTTFGVGTVAGAGLLGVSAFAAANAYFSVNAAIGAFSGLMAFITMGGVASLGATYVVLPLIATTFAVEAGVKLYNKRKGSMLVPEIAKV